MRKGPRAAMASVLTGGMLFLGVGAAPADSDHHNAAEHDAVSIDVEATDLVVGTATAVDERSVSLTTPSGTEVMVKWNRGTEFSNGDSDDLDAGVIIAALGTMRDSGTFRAEVIFFPAEGTVPGGEATARGVGDDAPAPDTEQRDDEADTTRHGDDDEADTTRHGDDDEADATNDGGADAGRDGR